jgi:hypothetical protein
MTMRMRHPDSAVVDLSIIIPLATKLNESMECAVRLAELMRSQSLIESGDARFLESRLPAIFDMISDGLHDLNDNIQCADEQQPNSLAEVAEELKARLRMLPPFDRDKFWADFEASAVAEAATAVK